jgi:4-hydroxy-tetrahydrodipicolinate synthase
MVKPMLPSVDGFVLLGSTGEAPSLGTAERKHIAEAVLSSMPADKRIVVGVSSSSVADAVSLAEHAQEHGAAAVLCCAPFYFLNSEEGMLRYFSALDRSLSVDLVIYDNPVTTKTTLSAAFVLRAAEQLEHLSAVKLTDHDLNKVRTWQAQGLSVLAGDDVILFQYLFAGVDGMMVIAPLLYPEPMARVWDLVRQQEASDAYHIFSEQVLPALHALPLGREVSATKEILQRRGTIRSAEVLPPLVDVDPAEAVLLEMADAACQAAYSAK